ncbi:MAG TPA: GNAT family N-acetyltransferase [Rhizomicrobium sp.]|jgi:RimJ/RimL family protein N-acetyltransferase
MRYTPRLLLRPPVVEDFDAYFEIHGDPQTNKFNPAGVPDKDKALAALAAYVADWREPGFGYWAVSTREASSLIVGFGGVRRKEFADGPALNLYFRFRPSAWGQGFATELAAAALEFAFRDLGEPRVLASTRANNLPSQKTLTRAGFGQIGQIDDVKGGTPSLLFQIRAEDFASRRA